MLRKFAYFLVVKRGGTFFDDRLTDLDTLDMLS